MNDTIGLNEEGIKKVIMDIYDYCEKINKTLNQISDVVEDTKNFYCCDTADEYRKKFTEFSSNFPTIVNSLKSYADDLNKLKSNVSLIDSNMAFSVKKNISKISNGETPINKISMINIDSIPKNNTNSNKKWW